MYARRRSSYDRRVRIRVLGSAAGGGFPQWNCGCPNCGAVREGRLAVEPRTQESIAVSADGVRWVLLNCSPDVAQQVEAFAPLRPRALRDTPIAAIVLTNGDLDHCLGLLVLREAQRLVVHATDAVRDAFVENPFARTLERFPGQVEWRAPALGVESPLADTGLRLTAVPAPGKPPLHREGRADPVAEDNVGLVVRDPEARVSLAYFPGVARLTDVVVRALDAADCVFFDGTFWAGDELRALGIGGRPAEAMGHLPVGGPAGSLAALASLRAPRRVYIHVNNTNPMLREDGPERAAVGAAGWEVASDGLELVLGRPARAQRAPSATSGTP
jgi:pyrroloquinoline quinone biosynthesis protein B